MKCFVCVHVCCMYVNVLCVCVVVAILCFCRFVLMNKHRAFLFFLRVQIIALSGVAQLVGATSHKPKDLGFHF